MTQRTDDNSSSLSSSISSPVRPSNRLNRRSITTSIHLLQSSTSSEELTPHSIIPKRMSTSSLLRHDLFSDGLLSPPVLEQSSSYPRPIRDTNYLKYRNFVPIDTNCNLTDRPCYKDRHKMPCLVVSEEAKELITIKILENSLRGSFIFDFFIYTAICFFHDILLFIFLFRYF